MSDSTPDREFWDTADAFIALANQRCDKMRHSKVSSALLYSAARFNSFVAVSFAKSKEEFVSEREANIAYFVGQYEKMLRENLADYAAHFDDYTGKPSERNE
jgi:hypothetical protein